MPRNKRIKIDAPFAACKETEKHYIFASYAHNNVKQVFPMLKNVYESGVNVWYDQGIEINSHYDDVIADRIANCDAFVLFLTNESVKRDYVIHNELQHARNNHKKVIVCRLENVHHIPKGVEMLLNNAESVSADDLVEKLKPYRSSPARVAQPISIKHSVDAPLPLQDYDCEYTSKGIILTRYKGNETDIVIPSQIDGYTVFGLKETFKNNKSIVSVSIPDTVKRIDYASFNHCRSLETLKIPSSVTFIGRYAFADCGRLTIGCEQGSTAHDYVQKNNMKYRLTQSNGGENKGNDYFKSTVSDAFVYAAYSHGDSETVMRILNKLNRDGCNIRYDEGITDNIDIYDDMVSCKAAIVFFSKTAADDEEFMKRDFLLLTNMCKNLLIVFLDDCSLPQQYQLKYGSKQALVRNNLSNNDFFVKLEEFVQNNDCISKATQISIPDFNFKIDSDGKIVLTDYRGRGGDVTVPATHFKPEKPIAKIDKRAFFRHTSVTSVSIPENIESIGQNAFAYCTGMKSISLPKSLSQIEDSAFSGCSGLTSVIIPSGVTYIGKEVFKDCNNLTICGAAHSEAEKYAKENKIPFKKLKRSRKWWLWILIILALLIGGGFALSYLGIVDFQLLIEQLFGK